MLHIIQELNKHMTTDYQEPTDLRLTLHRGVFPGDTMWGQIDVKPVEGVLVQWITDALRHQHVKHVCRRTPSGGKRVPAVVALQ